MVNDIIDLKTLNLEELTGVVTIYPWYAQARVELCRRMAAMGENAWSEQRFAQEALYVGSRKLIYRLIRTASDGSAYKDESARVEVKPKAEGSKPKFIVVGGDFFSPSDYEGAKEQDDNYFSGIRMGESVETNLENIEAEEFTDFCTETLAQVYLDQGFPEKARHIYSQLSLRYPEKSVYFAALIEKIG